MNETSTRGGSHHDTRLTLQYGGHHDEITEGTAEFAARSQHFTALGDSLTQCRFVSEGGYSSNCKFLLTTIGHSRAEDPTRPDSGDAMQRLAIATIAAAWTGRRLIWFGNSSLRPNQ
jgi:aldehyde:ferredoxin oxidoreductase